MQPLFGFSSALFLPHLQSPFLGPSNPHAILSQSSQLFSHQSKIPRSTTFASSRCAPLSSFSLLTQCFRVLSCFQSDTMDADNSDNSNNSHMSSNALSTPPFPSPSATPPHLSSSVISISSPTSNVSSPPISPPTIQMSDLQDISTVPAAFNLPKLLTFRGDLFELPDNTDAVPQTSHIRAFTSLESPPRLSIMHLPDEVLDIILRFLSSRPRAADIIWDNARDLSEAMKFALTNTRILNLFRNRLVTIRTRPERYREDLLYSAPTKGVIVDVRAPPHVSSMATLIRIAGPALKELVITRGLPRHTWVSDFAKNVTSLRRLSLRDVNPDYPLGPILRACSRSLRELQIVGATGVALSENQLQALGTYACSIHTLALRLSMFEHDWTPVWMGIGPGLKNLSIGATRFWIMDTEENALLEQIGRYCIDVEELHFYHLGPTLGNACARLCARYGDQLKSLELEQSQMFRSDLAFLKEHCPKTDLSISHGSSLFSHSYNSDVIEILGEQIRVLRYRSQLAHDESLWQVGHRCMSLRELRLDCASVLDDHILKLILTNTATTLQVLSMGFFVRGVERALVSSAVDALASHAQVLERLHIGTPKFDVASWTRLMERCKKTMKKVSVTFGFRNASEREVIDTETIIGVVSALYVCEEVHTLDVLDRTSTPSEQGLLDIVAIRQSIQPLRRRMNHISVCGVHYLR